MLRGLPVADLYGKQQQKAIHKPQKDAYILEEQLKHIFCAWQLLWQSV